MAAPLRLSRGILTIRGSVVERLAALSDFGNAGGRDG